jgi:hypothetical protein
MILRLPDAASSKLPSRGMSMVEGTFNGYAFQTPLVRFRRQISR